MKRRHKISLLNLTHPAQSWSLGLLVAGVVLAAAMLMLEKAKPELVSPVRGVLLDVTAPLSKLLAAPKRGISSASDAIHDLFYVYEENQRLKEENATLLSWQAKAHQYVKENEQLRGLLRVVPEGQHYFISARMVPAFGQELRKVALIGAGSEEGVKKDLAVITAQGLIGRVIEAGKHNAQVLLVKDVNANIPVMSERSGYKAIITGDPKHSALKLDLVDRLDDLQVGDRLVTSGDGGMIPPGIPVASITSINGTTILAAPLADIDRALMATIINYTF